MTDQTQQGRRSDRRAQVLRAALEAFAEVGADRVRIQDIATRAGMSSGHVMYYFPDRESILVDTLLLSEGSLAERRDRAIARAGTADEALDRITRLYLPTGPRDVRWTLWAQVVARPPESPRAREQLRAASDGWAAAVASVLRTGAPLTETEAHNVAYRYCRLMDGLALEVLLAAPSSSRTWAVEEARQALESMID